MIDTPRLILRNYTIDDFDALFEILSDPKNTVSYAYSITRSKWEALQK